MGKAIPTVVLDEMLTVAEGDKLVVCSAEPTNYTEANTTYKLAEVTLVPADFTKAAGDTNGRKTTVAAKNGVPILANGTATHVAIVKVSNTTLRRVTTCASQPLTIGGTVDIAGHKHELAIPT